MTSLTGRIVQITPVPIMQCPAAGTPTCAFSVDVEDWYQSCIDFDAPVTERVVRNVDRVLSILDQAGIKATFFVQGLVAKTFPHLVQSLVDEGHEIQSHGSSHRPLSKMNYAGLRNELERARKTVEDACGRRVTAFRAPDFSILKGNLWALEVLANVGFEVDSSIFPLRTYRYGIGGWDVGPQKVMFQNGAAILEVPVTIWTPGRWRIPVAGGGYLRQFPYFMVEHALRAICTANRPVVIYCHPYEFNPEELRDYRGKVSTLFRLSQGIGRKSFSHRISMLLEHLPFGRFDEVLRAWKVI